MQLLGGFRKLHLASEEAELAGYRTIAVTVAGGVCVHAALVGFPGVASTRITGV